MWACQFGRVNGFYVVSLTTLFVMKSLPIIFLELLTVDFLFTRQWYWRVVFVSPSHSYCLDGSHVLRSILWHVFMKYIVSFIFQCSGNYKYVDLANQLVNSITAQCSEDLWKCQDLIFIVVHVNFLAQFSCIGVGLILCKFSFVAVWWQIEQLKGKPLFLHF